MVAKKYFAGMWHIFEMEMWDPKDFNMEVQAFIEIEDNMMGRFQFILVSGEIDGGIVSRPDGDMFEFTWEGNDENDSASGSGWMKIKDNGTGRRRIQVS